MNKVKHHKDLCGKLNIRVRPGLPPPLTESLVPPLILITYRCYRNQVGVQIPTQFSINDEIAGDCVCPSPRRSSRPFLDVAYVPPLAEGCRLQDSKSDVVS
jgi:hypothetical protein